MENLFILYDAECSLCSKARSLVERNDVDRRFTFVAITSKQARAYAKKHNKTIDPQDPESFVLCDDKGELWLEKSQAVYAITKQLHGPVHLNSYLLYVTPTLIADRLYSLVAGNRKCDAINSLCDK